MLNHKVANSILAATAGMLCAALLAVGCGSTDGGSAVDNDAGLGIQYVSDGGAGGSIAIDVKDSLAVGGTAAFSVSVKDPRGEPIAFTRVFCESEHGIAILEPSKGGVAFEHTDMYGNMSGVLGGVSKGSYVLECRAPIEYNLIARVTVKITGDAPAGFTGFPGAAGGNLGGGRIVPPSTDELRITKITFTDLGEESLFLDNQQNANCDGDSSTYDPEQFTVKTYKLSLYNGTQNTITIKGVSYVSGTETSNQSVEFEIAAGGTTIYEGQYETAQSTALYNVQFTVTAETVNSSNEITVTGTQAVEWLNIDNCTE